MKLGRGLVHAALRRHPAGAVDRLSGLFATALLCLSLPAVGELSSPASAAVWYVDHRNLVQIDPKTDQPVISVGLPSASDALAVDPADGSPWVLAKRQLLKFDRTGGITQTIDLRALSGRFDEPGQLVLNPHDRSLWITGERRIVLLDSGGRLIGETSLPEHIQSAALDLDDHLWVVTEKQLYRLAPDLTIQPSQSLRSITAAPRHIAVDRLGERLWLAGRRELVAIDSVTGRPVTRISLEAALGGRGDGGDVDALAVHPVFGTVWVAVRQNLLVYDRQGQVLKEIALTPFDLGEVEAMAFDPVEFGLWLGGKKALGHFRSNGEFVGRVSVQSELEALATPSFWLRPTLTLLAPPTGQQPGMPTHHCAMGWAVTAPARPVT